MNMLNEQIRAIQTTIGYYKKELKTAQEMKLSELEKTYAGFIDDLEKELQKLLSATYEQPVNNKEMDEIKEQLKLTFYDYDIIPEAEIEAVILDKLNSGELDDKDLTMKTFEVKKILQGLR
ncbi:MAG: hypothetical protein K8V75_06950 [Methanobrevibacter woesei]|nr:hypothetical protein [Methanobrevibacter woesei]